MPFPSRSRFPRQILQRRTDIFWGYLRLILLPRGRHIAGWEHLSLSSGVVMTPPLEPLADGSARLQLERRATHSVQSAEALGGLCLEDLAAALAHALSGYDDGGARATGQALQARLGLAEVREDGRFITLDISEGWPGEPRVEKLEQLLIALVADTRSVLYAADKRCTRAVRAAGGVWRVASSGAAAPVAMPTVEMARLQLLAHRSAASLSAHTALWAAIAAVVALAMGAMLCKLLRRVAADRSRGQHQALRTCEEEEAGPLRVRRIYPDDDAPPQWRQRLAPPTRPLSVAERTCAGIDGGQLSDAGRAALAAETMRVLREGGEGAAPGGRAQEAWAQEAAHVEALERSRCEDAERAARLTASLAAMTEEGTEVL